MVGEAYGERAAGRPLTGSHVIRYRAARPIPRTYAAISIVRGSPLVPCPTCLILINSAKGLITNIVSIQGFRQPLHDLPEPRVLRQIYNRSLDQNRRPADGDGH
jgi:hypothetical protein